LKKIIGILAPSLALCVALWAGNVSAETSLTRFENQIVSMEGQPMPEPNGIVVAGSSTIRLWSTIKTDLAPLPIVQRGFGGSTAAELNYYLDRIVLPYKPRAVVIYEGENDLAEKIAPERIQSEIKSIVTKIKAELPEARIYIIGVKPSISRSYLLPATATTNGLLAALCAKDPRLTFIDAGKGLLGADGQPVRKYFGEDLLHLSSEGYKVWTAAIRPILLADDKEKVPKAPTDVKVYK